MRFISIFFFSFRRRGGKQEEIRVSDIRRHDKQDDLSKNFWKYRLNLKHLKKKYALYVMFAHEKLINRNNRDDKHSKNLNLIDKFFKRGGKSA